MKIHFVAALSVIVCGSIFQISKIEWIICLLSISLIFALEAINTAIEKLCNHVTPNFDNEIKIVKDIAAGAVLLASIGVAIVGLIIFVPYIVAYFV